MALGARFHGVPGAIDRVRHGVLAVTAGFDRAHFRIDYGDCGVPSRARRHHGGALLESIGATPKRSALAGGWNGGTGGSNSCPRTVERGPAGEHGAAAG